MRGPDRSELDGRSGTATRRKCMPMKRVADVDACMRLNRLR